MVAKNNFEIVLPKREQKRFIDALMKWSGAAQDAYANLRIANATAYMREDVDKSMGKVDASVGRAKVSCRAKVNI